VDPVLPVEPVVELTVELFLMNTWLPALQLA
jgi:hypothetical protein